MPLVRNVAAALVVIGVAAEFLEGWISEPWRETVEHARELQMAQLARDAETAKADIATANATAAEATERAARAQADNTQLEIRLEEERKSRIALQKALSTPHLTPEQIDQLAQAVRGRVPQLTMQYTSDASSLALAQDIKTAFERAGVPVEASFSGMMSPKPYGLFVRIPSEEFRFLTQLFQEFDLEPTVTLGANLPVALLVGEKRPPF
jgi:hypothetical protein